MVNETPKVYEFAGGEVTVWIDGCICIKTRNKCDDPVELADEEALELSELLKRLVKEGQS
jgi:hypothetical protein